MSMFSCMGEDIAAVLDSDPAAKSGLEVVILYSGLHALWGYRIHHWLWLHGWRFAARAMSQFGRLLTGIEIHPGRGNRPALLRRSWHGRGHRRDHDYRR